MSGEPACSAATGRKTAFEAAVRADLLRWGASLPIATRAAQTAARCRTPASGIRLACRTLARGEPRAAVRASLEFGLRHLGPTGGPFEEYVARLLTAFGYRTELGARRAGRTVEHEIDIVAEREERTLFCECKLRTKPDARVDLGTVLAAFGRAADLGALGDGPVQSWLITNARFTDDAEAFALGSGLHLLGWDQPPDSDLPSRIDEVGRYPITALPHLPDAAARRLIAAGIVDTDALLAAPQRLEASGVLPARIAQILAEAESVRARDTG